MEHSPPVSEIHEHRRTPQCRAQFRADSGVPPHTVAAWRNKIEKKIELSGNFPS